MDKKRFCSPPMAEIGSALSLCLLLASLALSPRLILAAAPRIEQTGNQNPTVAALSPTVSRGSSVTLTARFADPDGVSDLGVVNILVNKYLDGVGACYLAYDAQSNWLHVVGDTGAGLQGAAPGSSTQLTNSQCSIAAADVVANRFGQMLELEISLVLRPGFAGSQVVYLAARDIHGGNSGWQPSGVIVRDESNPGPAVVAMTPAEAEGAAETLTVAYRLSGGGSLSPNQILVNRDLDGRNACYVGYDNLYHNLFLVADDGDSLLPAVHPAYDDVPGAGVAENSQCVIDGALSSAVNIGEHLYLSVHMRFKDGFDGKKIVYAASQTSAGLNTGWQAVGTALPRPLPDSVRVFPADATQDAPTKQRVLFAFERPVDAGSVNSSSARLLDGSGNPVATTAVLSEDGLYLSLRPDQQLTEFTDYRAEADGLLFQSGAPAPKAATYFRTTSASPHSSYLVASATNFSSQPDTGARNVRLIVDYDRPVDPTSFQDAVAVHPFGAAPGRLLFSKGLKRVTFEPSALYPLSETVYMAYGASALGGELLSGRSPTVRTTTEISLAVPSVRYASVNSRNGPSQVYSEIAFTAGVDRLFVQDSALRVLCAGLPTQVRNQEFSDSSDIATFTFDTTTGPASDCALIAAGLVSESGVEQQAAFAVGIQPDGADTTPASVIHQQPYQGATDAPLDTTISVVFSEPVLPINTLGERTATAENGAAFEVILAPDRTSVEFRPLQPLQPETLYRIWLGYLTDAAGNYPGGQGYLLEFTTGTAATDNMPPTVVQVSPPPGALGVGWSIPIEIVFSEAINEGATGKVELRDPSGNLLPLRDAAAYGNHIPSEKRVYYQDFQLPGGGQFTVSVSGFIDAAGNVVTPYSFSFLAPTTDVTNPGQPYVTSVSPPDGATGVDIHTAVVVRASQHLLPTELYRTDFSSTQRHCCNWQYPQGVSINLNGVFVPVDHVLSQDGGSFTVTPRQALRPDTTYEIHISGLLNWYQTGSQPQTTTFTTSPGAPDTAPPHLAAAEVSPDSGRFKTLTLTFDEAMDPASVFEGVTVLLEGRIDERNTNPAFDWSSSLDGRAFSRALEFYGSSADVKVIVSSQATDLSGNPIALTEVDVEFEGGTQAPGEYLLVRPSSGSEQVPTTNPITYLFHGPIDPASIDGNAWVTANGEVVEGSWTVEHDGRAIVFRPDQPFPESAFIKSILLQNGIRGANGGYANPTITTFRTAPGEGFRVLGVNPLASSNRPAPRNARLAVRLNRPADPATVNAANFLVRTGSAEVPGAVSLSPDRRVIYFDATGLLPATATVWLTLNANIMSSDGLRLEGGSSHTFPIGTEADSTPPLAPRISPAAHQTAGGNATIRIRLNELASYGLVEPSQIGIVGPAGPIEILGFRPITYSIEVTPAELLEPGLYTVSVQGLLDAAGNPAPPASAQIRIGAEYDVTEPRIVGGWPGQYGLAPLNPLVTINFSEPLDSESVIETLMATSNGVPFTVTLGPDDRRVAVAYQGLLPTATRETITMSELTDPTGNRLGYAYDDFPFETTLAPDFQPPALLQASPEDGAMQAPRNTVISAVFDEIVQPGLELSPITVSTSGQVIEGETAWAGETITFTPYARLEQGATYTIRIAGVRDLAGNPLASPVVTTFSTEGGGDYTRPTVRFNVGEDLLDAPRSLTLRAEFSERIQEASLDVELATVYEFVPTPIEVTVLPDNRTVIAKPLSLLEPNQRYQFSVGGVVLDLAGNQVTHPTSILFTTGELIDNGSAPQLTAQYPPADATQVGGHVQVFLMYDEPLDDISAQNAATLMGPDGLVALLERSQPLRYAGLHLITLAPQSALAPNTTYTVQVSGLRDLQDNVSPPEEFSFTTGTGTLEGRPQVIDVQPPNGATGLPLTTPIRFTMAPPVSPHNAFPVNGGSSNVTITPIGGVPVSQNVAVEYRVGSTTFTITPTLPLSPDTTYTVTIGRFFGVNPYVGGSDTVTTQFTTTSSDDVTAPTVLSVTPGDGSGEISPSVSVFLTFDEPVHPSTVTPDTVGLFIDGDLIDSLVAHSADARTVTLRPNSSYPPSSTVEVVVTGGVQDLAGNPSVPFSSSFDVLPATAHGPALTRLLPLSVAPGGLPLHLFFDQPVAEETLPEGVLVSVGGVLQPGMFSLVGDGRTVKFVPNEPFPASTTIRVFLTGALRNLAGIPRQSTQESTIHTGGSTYYPSEAFTPPCYVSSQFSYEAPSNTVFRLRTNYPLDPGTVTPDGVSFTSDGNPVPGTFELFAGDRGLQFTPAMPLEEGKQYTLEATRSLRYQGGPYVFRNAQRCQYVGTPEDTVPPMPSRFLPDVDRTDVARNSLIRVEMDSPIGAVSLRDAIVELAAAETPTETIPVSVSFLGLIVEISPHTLLEPGRTYQVRVAGLTDNTNLLMDPLVYEFTVGEEIDLDPPVFELASPAGAGVPLNAVPAVRFNEPLDPTSLTPLNISGPSDFGRLRTHSLSGDGRTAYIRPDQLFEPNTQYFLQIRDVRDLAGNQSQINFQPAFVTGSSIDSTNPQILARFPADGSTSHPRNVEPTFLIDQSLDPATLKPPFVRLFNASGETSFRITTSLEDRLVRIKPLRLLQPLENYTLMVAGLQNLTGGELPSGFTTVFSTGSDVQFSPLQVVASSPAEGATNVSRTGPIEIVFDRPLNPNTVNVDTVTLQRSGGNPSLGVNIALSSGNTRLLITPISPLDPNTQFFFEVSPEVTDATGASVSYYRLFFTTGT